MAADQKLAARFVRARAVEMHMDMSEGPFMREYTGKRPQTKTAPRVLCEPAQSKCTWTCQRVHFMREFTGKRPQTKTAPRVLCEPAQSKCTWTCHKSHFLWKLIGKRPQTKSKPNSRRTVLREPAAVETHMDISQEQVRAILYENLQEETREPRVSTSIKHRPSP